jgi:ketosteroid isomerase-like protein
MPSSRSASAPLWPPLLAAGVCCLFAASASATSEDELSALLKRQTQEFSEAGQQGDVAVLDRYLDPTAVLTEEDGSVDHKQDMLQGASPPPKGISSTNTVTDWKLSHHGNTAIATFVDDQVETVYGQTLNFKYRSTEVWRKGGSTWRLIASQTLALQQDPPAVALAPADLQDYVGTYRLAQDFTVQISLQDGVLVSSTNGGQAVPLKAELRDVLFTPGQPRQRKIFQRDDAGHVTGYVSRREGRDLALTKVG